MDPGPGTKLRGVHLRAWVSGPGEDSGCRGFQRATDTGVTWRRLHAIVNTISQSRLQSHAIMMTIMQQRHVRGSSNSKTKYGFRSTSTNVIYTTSKVIINLSIYELQGWAIS
eukprot:685129-Prymnesium_polylepis.1